MWGEKKRNPDSAHRKYLQFGLNFLVVTILTTGGPRPLPTYYMPYYSEAEHQRHKVRGGLIPADTISGKAVTTWDEQLEWDVYYANNCSFVLDVKILVMTFKILLDRSKTDYGSVDRPHLSEERSGEKDTISR